MRSHSWIAIGLVLGLAACAGSNEKTDSQLGETQVSEGTGQVPVREEVVAVETHEVPTVTSTSQRADINRMEEEDFVAMGFTPDAAENIIERREELDGFDSPQQLRGIEGVNPEHLSSLEGQLGVSPTDRSG